MRLDHAIISAQVLETAPELLLKNLPPRALDRIFNSAEVPIFAAEPEGRSRYLPKSALLRLLSSAARELGVDNFGVLFGPSLKLENWGAYGGFLSSAETLGDALRRATQVQPFWSSSDSISIRDIDKNRVAVHYHDPFLGHVGSVDFSISVAFAGIRLIKLYLGPGWRPLRINLPGATSMQCSTLEDCFQCPVTNIESELIITFDRYMLDATSRFQFHGTVVSLTDVQRSFPIGVDKNIASLTKEIIHLQLLDQAPTIRFVAKHLRVHPRSLQRLLADQGTSFRELLGQARMERARQLLKETRVSITTISDALGYQNQGHFGRAFSKVVGNTPSAYRKIATGAEARL